jgi:hypothetical protein
MKISIDEIKQAFEFLIKEKKSREELSLWAQKLQMAHDNDDLEYDPSNEKERIWDGIKYLMGVDLRDIDGSYLHSVENFIQYKAKKKL